jgi:hypothetical protein
MKTVIMKLLKEKKVIQCRLCFDYGYCNIFLKNLQILERYMFPDQLPRCFCCNRIAIIKIK